MASSRPALLSRDPIVRLVVVHWILGALTGVGCASLLIFLDVAGLRTLLVHSDCLWIGVILLASGFAVTFGGVITASAVMLMPSGEEPGPSARGAKRIVERAKKSMKSRIWFEQI